MVSSPTPERVSFEQLTDAGALGLMEHRDTADSPSS